MPRSRTSMATRSAPSRRVFRRIGSAWRRVRPGHDGVPGVRQDVDQRQPQPFGVGADRRAASRSRSSVTASVVSTLTALAGVVAERVEVGGRQVELDRPGEVEHLGHDAVEPGDLLVDVGDRGPERLRARRSRPRRPRSAVLMIISGLRISCATTVESRPSDDSRSRCAASRWKRAIESVIVLKVVASSRASSSSHRAAARQRDPPRQVAGGRHLAHRRGDRAERPGDRARDGVADERRGEDGEDRRAEQFAVDRAQEAQPLGARPQDDRGREVARSRRWRPRRSASEPASG